MSQPLISVIIGCYNTERWLEETVASVRAQTWKNLELILVDDGSTDGTGRLIDRLADARTKVIHQANAGQSAALNRGFQAAQGQLIEFLDADDLLAPQKLSVQVERLNSLPPGWIASGAWARFTGSPDDATFTPEPVWRDLDPVTWLVTSWSGGGMMHGAAWLAPRAAVDAAGPWNESLTLINDFEYFPRLLLAGKGVAFCPEAKTYYRSVAGSVSKRTSRVAWESAFTSTRLGTQTLLARENSPRTREAAAINWQRFIYSAYPYASDLVRKGEKAVKELGGGSLRPGGGKVFQILCKIVGWKLARRIQMLGRSLFYEGNS